jgi:peptide/nickel transport system permease protein
MTAYILRRLLFMVPTLLLISFVCFLIIQLPPGDYITSYVAALEAEGTPVSEAEIESLRIRYSLDEPFLLKYVKWIWSILSRGDFGHSFVWRRAVIEVIGERIGYTILLSGLSLLFVWVIAIPVGIYSAVRQYSPEDYVFTFFAFLGKSIPDFLLALVLMYFLFANFGWSIGGLFSREYALEPWSVGKLLNMLQNLIVPVIVVGTSGTAGLTRLLRNMMLDELGKHYVTTARAKGLREFTVILRHPLKIALNPVFSTVGWILPALISGETIVSIVVNLPTTGPMMFRALMNQDMFVAGGFLLIISSLIVVGTLISDIILANMDPRITYE